MLGWKTVERTIAPSVSLSQAKEIVTQDGFTVQTADSSHAIFKKSGNRLTTSGRDFPLELAIAETDSGLLLQLRYDAFVLFDTGDLNKFADEIVAKLQ